MDPGILAAIQMLPKYNTVIKELALHSESFRSLCGDLVEAEQALRRWDKSQDPERAVRRAEYKQLVEGLEAELRQVISAWQARNRNQV